jgi:hypothetical protein
MNEPGDEMGMDEMGSADMSGADFSGAAMDCAGLAEVAAELALGVLTGRERAQAIAHLEQCDTCREDVRQLMATSDGLLVLLPEIEPPAGFETRVLDRMGLSVPAGGENAARPRPAPKAPGASKTRRASKTRGALKGPGAAQTPRAPGRRPVRGARRLIAAAAVAVAVIGAGIVGWGMGTATAPRPGLSAAAPAALDSAALLTASDQNVGRVSLYPASKAHNGQQWMYMTVNLPSGEGTVTCQLVSTDGKATTVGWFRLADGHGAWGSAGSWGTTVHGARLLAANGTVLAKATFAHYTG